MYIDPSGNIAISTLIIIGSFVLGAITGGYVAYDSYKQTGEVDLESAVLTGISVIMLSYTLGMSAYGMYEYYCLSKGNTPITEIKFNANKGGAASGADNIATGAKLKEFYRQAEKYGTGSIKELENGKFRFYGDVKVAAKKGEMAGARLVREWDPATGTTKTWYETLDKAGNIRQVRPNPNLTGGLKTHYMFDVDGNYTGSWIPKK